MVSWVNKQNLFSRSCMLNMEEDVLARPFVGAVLQLYPRLLHTVKLELQHFLGFVAI